MPGVTGPEASDDDSGPWFGTLGSVVALLAVTWTVRLATLPLNDNSFFTHLATGRLILDRGSVPTSDPYSFTAAGTEWTVQSWLASVLYAVAERAGGADGIKLLVAAIFALATAGLWALSRRAESIFLRVGIVGAALAVSTDTWSARPYMFGVLGLIAVWLALEGRLAPWALVPVFWVWANTHGSWILGGVLAGAVTAGTWLDRRGDGADTTAGGVADPAHALRVLLATGVGAVVACAGPLGPRAVLFPLTALERSDVLSNVREWMPSDFADAPERVFLLVLLATAASLVQLRAWRYTLPTLVFLAAAVVAQRNIVLATVAFVPVLAAAAPSVGTLRSRSRIAGGPVLAGLGVVLVALAATSMRSQPGVRIDGYPARAIAWVGPDPEGRLATQDFTGNLLEVLDGPTGAVFMDDRYDMYPVEFTEDYLRLADGRAGWEGTLDELGIEQVVWRRDTATASLLATDVRWRIEFSDTEWVVACRRGSASCEAG